MAPKVLYVGLDGCDGALLLQLAAAGRCPHIASLIEQAAVVPTVAPYGTFVGSSWMTISTGRDVSRHGYWNWLEVDPQTYVTNATTPRQAKGRPFWEHVSDSGRRVAVLDVPHMGLPDEFNGVLLKEWGCHDRHDGTESLPRAVLVELDHSVGRHPVGCARHPAGDDAFAPCDYTMRAGLLRTADEERSLLELIQRGVDVKHRASLDLLAKEPWDLFATVFGESHCVGHQFWHVHDVTHPRHDPARRRLLGDPVEDVYARLDAAVGDLLAHADSGTAVYLQLNHGMGPHFDGDHLLDELLLRIDHALAGQFAPGRLTRIGQTTLDHSPKRVRAAMRRVAAAAVRITSRRGAPALSLPTGPRADRRWFQIAGNTTVGAVRFNVVGREAHGMVQPGAEFESLRHAVGAALLDVIDVATGLPIVSRLVPAEEVYQRRADDRLPDLFVEWTRTSLVEQVWSPLTGVVAAPYSLWRTGDHHDRGLLVVRADGVEPGRRQVPMALVDSGPTIAAALGVELPDVDGKVRSDLVPSDRAGRVAGRVAAATTVVHRLPEVVADVQGQPQADERSLAATAIDVSAATARRLDTLATDVPGWIHGVHHRVLLLEREQLVRNTMAWLASEPVRDEVLVSVVTPTFHRPDLLAEAISSVIAQRHRRWEMVIVDDGSDTAREVAAKFADMRLRVIDADHGGACAARNRGLEQVVGDVVTFLDDDNVLDPGWLHAVAWACANRPEIDVMYGARVIDDSLRVGGEGAGGWPSMQFVPFDRQALLDHNYTDIGVLAHRAGRAARFDESFVECGDWDYLLALTEHSPALELPAIAVYYRTHGGDRLTGQRPVDADRVRAKWARRSP